MHVLIGFDVGVDLHVGMGILVGRHDVQLRQQSLKNGINLRSVIGQRVIVR